jgi:large subunit ribosomal protein L20
MVLPRKAKIFKAAKGFRGRRKNCWTQAVRSVHKAWQYAYIGRKLKKRDFRAAWIQSINAAVRGHGLRYSWFMKWLPRTGMELNRKVLSDIAATEPYSFKAVVEAVRLVAAQAGDTAGAVGAGRAPRAPELR